jgi:hypothetical protein
MNMALQKVTVATILGVAVAATAVVAMVAAGLVASLTIPNSGNVKTVGVKVYWDAQCTNTTSSISWGNMGPGDSKSFTVYVMNTGGTSEVLNMTTSNWSSSTAQSKISVTWNREGYALTQGTVVSTVLTLSIDSTISSVTGFTFDMTITGTGI